RPRRRRGVLAGSVRSRVQARGGRRQRALHGAPAGRQRPGHRHANRGCRGAADRLPRGAGRQARRRRALRDDSLWLANRLLHAAWHRPPGSGPGPGPGRAHAGGVTVMTMIRRGKGSRRRRWHELRDKRRRGIVLLPSLLTTGNLFCGFFALLLTVEGRYSDASLAIFVAMIMDLLDGRVARLMKATSQFGVEFDSLADVVSFCVAPAFLVYSYALKDLSRPAWFGVFLFVICGALRLARFNVQTGTVDRRFFIGLSTPAAAGVIAASVVLLGDEPPERWEQIALASASGILALLMVSTFRYWSFKEVDFVRRRPVQTLLVVVLAIMIVAAKHDVFLFALFTGYALSGPVRRVFVGRTHSAPAERGSKESP